MASRKLTPDELSDLTITIFTAAGWTASDASDLAEHLVRANLQGHDSHGVGMIPAYIQAWKDGLLLPSNKPEVVRDAPPFFVVDAHVALGQPAAKAATLRAVDIARQSGVCIFNLANANHVGRVGHYAEIAASAGMIAMFWVNVAGREPVVAPFGAKVSRFGTNPHTIGVPNGEQPLILDFATSRTANGKMRVAYNKGEKVPLGYLIDKDGNPTDDPAVVQTDRSGSLLPFGDHKGAGVALMAEILAAGLSGPGKIISETAKKSWIVNNMFGIVFDPAGLDADEAERARRIAALVEWQRSAATAEGVDHVRSPGDKERETMAVRMRDGIPVDDETWRQLMAAAQAVGAAQ